MAKLTVAICSCNSCTQTHKCDFYRMACVGQDCAKCKGPMEHGGCCDYERKV